MSDREELEALRRLAELEAKAAGPGPNPAKDYGGLPFRPFGIDTGLTMPQGVGNFMAGTGKAVVDTGRGLGQLTGQVSTDDIKDSRKRDAALMDTGAGFAGNIAGNVGMAVAPGAALKGASMLPRAGQWLGPAGDLLLAPKTIAQGLAVGAPMGLIQPAENMQERLTNTGVGAVGTAAVPVVSRSATGAWSALEPLYQGGRDKIIGRALNRAAGDDAASAAARMAGAKELIPGSLPTAGQVAQNPGIAAMERAAGAIEPQAYGQRAIDQNQARVAAVRGIAGTQSERAAAEAARKGASNALYNDAYKEGVDVSRFAKGTPFNPMAEAVKNGTEAAPEYATSLISTIKKMGGITSAQGTLRDITGEARVGKNVKGIPPGLFHKNGAGLDDLATRLRDRGYMIPEDASDGGVQTLKDMIRDELNGVQKHYSSFDEEAVFAQMANRFNPPPPLNSQNAPQRRVHDTLSELLKRPAMRSALSEASTLAENEGIKLTTPAGSIQGLDYIGRALKDQIGKAERGSNEARVLTGLRDEFLQTIDTLSPKYKQARNTFTEMSKPINAMDVGGALADKLEPALAGNGTRLNASAFARALRDGDATAAKATGFGGSTLENTLQPGQLNTLKNVQADLERSAFAKDAGRGAGSDTIQKLAQSNVMEQAGIPTFLRNFAPTGILGNLLSRASDAIYTPMNTRMAQSLSHAMLNPQQAAMMMQLATPSQRAAMLADFARRGLTPLGMSAPAQLNAAQQ